MKIHLIAVFAASMTAVSFSSFVAADPDKNESGNGRQYEHRKHNGGEFKEEFWDGDCKVERKYERNGNYKEERKCSGDGPRSHRNGHRHAPREESAGRVVVTPPSVVIQPPSVVIKAPPIRIE